MATREYEWHRQRQDVIRNAHPEVIKLQGRDPSSAVYVVALTVGQLLLAASLVGQPLWLVLLVAMFIGTLPAHALGVLIHEASHNLIAKGVTRNKLWALVANLSLIGPAAVEFRYQHLLHHRFLGEALGRDTQAPPRREAEVVGTSWWKKLLSFTFGRFVFSNHDHPPTPKDRWLLANWITCVSTGALVAALLDWSSFWYLVASGLLAFGPSVLGARRLSEHLPVVSEQPTNSYYGFLNHFSFNVGFHVEHHDFPGVPWRNLPKLRALAPEMYRSLFAFQSWGLLIARYFFVPTYRVDHYIGMGDLLPPSEADILDRRRRRKDPPRMNMHPAA